MCVMEKPALLRHTRTIVHLSPCEEWVVTHRARPYEEYKFPPCLHLPGMLQVLANLVPVFVPAGCDFTSPVSGELRLKAAEEDKFPWIFTKDGRGYTITALSSRIPSAIVFPAGGQVYIVWEGTNVKWQWSGGVVAQVPPNAVWLLDKVSELRNHGRRCPAIGFHEWSQR